MEMAAQVRSAFLAIQPDCVAVELAETMQLQLLHAASRLPDISIVTAWSKQSVPIYYLCEPCEPAFEGLRSALESGVSAWCIDLDVDFYPDRFDILPDPYAIQRIGLKNYYEAYQKICLVKGIFKSDQDRLRELYMAKRLKELSLRHDRILYVGGMAHVEAVFSQIDRSSFPLFTHAARELVEINTLTESSCRDVMAECGWITQHYEQHRSMKNEEKEAPAPDRQKLIYSLYRSAAESYVERSGNPFPGYHMRNLMKFLRNYALIRGRLMPTLFQLLSCAKCCVDDNYAYEVWDKATKYPLRRNLDNLSELDLTIEQVWGNSKLLRFNLKSKSPKAAFAQRQRKDRSKAVFQQPGPFNICSYPPEDILIEKFGDFLKKKGTQLLTEEATRTVPFTTSLEDGLDTKETIRHWHEKKLYVKTRGKPPGGVGSVVMIFDEDDESKDETSAVEKYPWKTTWLGEHSQESDMAFYATSTANRVVGPGISRCEYGGFMMSYPPRRMFDVWGDPDYTDARTKSEVLLMAAIDYAIKPLITYVGARPPRSALKSYARRFGKKVVYIPIGQLSPITLNKLRLFHVLDGREKREIAGDYI